MKARKQAVRSWFSEAEEENTERNSGLSSSEVEGYSDFAKSNSSIDALLFALYSSLISLSIYWTYRHFKAR